MKQVENRVGLTSREREAVDFSGSIQGWGADLEPEMRPGVPRDKAPYIGIEKLYPDIERQLTKVKILKSTEHEQMPPVFGTTCPPVGVSGAIREFAFRYSEGEFTHWLALLFADRVNVIEDLVKDLSIGHVPNLYKEMGLATEWKYNRKNVLAKGAVVGLGLAAIGGLLAVRSKKKSI